MYPVCRESLVVTHSNMLWIDYGLTIHIVNTNANIFKMDNTCLQFELVGIYRLILNFSYNFDLKNDLYSIIFLKSIF
jgi:hypothetical protein